MKNYLWIPRVLTIIFILFISLFALDVFSMDTPLYQQIGGFVIHIIPSIIIAIILVVFWKNPYYSGLAYILLAIAFTLFFHTYQNFYSFILLSFLPAFIGFLFIIFKKPMKKKK